MKLGNPAGEFSIVVSSLQNELGPTKEGAAFSTNILSDMHPFHDASVYEPCSAAKAYVEVLKAQLYRESWDIVPRPLCLDQLHRFRSSFRILEELVFKIEMHLYTILDWIERDVFEWLVKLVVVVSIQRERMRASPSEQAPSFIMKSEDTLALLDLLETSVSIVIGIVEWSRQAAWLYDHVEAGQALGDQCSPLHRWLMCQSVPNDITAEFLGCPCLTHENRLLSINMHLPPLAHNTSDLPSPPSSLHTPTSPRSPGSSCANDSLSPLHPNQTSPSRKRSVDTRTPCSVVFATQNMRRSSKRSHSQECHIFLDTSADTIVDNSILAFPEGKEQAASWEGEEDADKDASEGCSSIVVDDDFATLVGSDDGYDLDLEKHGYDYCSSTFSVDDEPASDEDGTSAEPSPSSLHDKPYTPTSYAFGGIEISTKLPLWSRFFKLVLPFWSSL